MNAKDIKNDVGLSGVTLCSATIKNYEKECEKIEDRFGEIDIKKIDADGELSAVEKSRMISAAYMMLSRRNGENEELRNFARECLEKYKEGGILREPKKKLGVNKIVDREKMVEVFREKLKDYEADRNFRNAFFAVIGAAYGIQPPLRLNEYLNAIVVFDEKEEAIFSELAKKSGCEEYIVPQISERKYFNVLNLEKKEFVININKTAKKTGQKKIELVDEFLDVLRCWRKEFDKIFPGRIPWLCLLRSGKKIDKSAMSKLIKEFFGAVPTALRKSVVKSVEKNEDYVDERVKLSKQMLHSVLTSEIYYNKK